MLTFKSDRKQRAAILRVTCLALMMVVAGVASLNVALPGIAARHRRVADASSSGSSTRTRSSFAALLLPAGAIGDRFGRKPILAAGIALFGLASGAALFADTAGQLIGLRAVMGVAAAMIMPVTLSVITTVFPPEERGKAVGTWAGVAAGGAVLGLLASGVLLEWLSWQSVFGLNVVLAPVALAGTLAIVPATRESRPPRLDPIGTLLSATGLAALVFAIIEGPERGWSDPLTASALAFGAAAHRRLRRLGAAPARPDARPAQLPAARLRRRLALDHRAVLLGVRLPVPRPPVPAARPGLLAARGVAGARADGDRRDAALARRAARSPRRLGVRVTGAAGLSLMATGSSILSTLDPLVATGRSSPGSCPSAPGWRSQAPRRRPRSSPRSRARSRAWRRRSTTSRASSAARSGSRCSAA